MNLLKKILAVLIAILFVISAVIALVFFNINRKAFAAETYQRVLANEKFYDRLPGVIAEVINSASFTKSELPSAMRGMGIQAWDAFFRAILPQETLKSMGNEALNSVFNYLNMETNSAQLSLLPLKTSMISDTGTEAVYSLLNAQPDCTLEQAAQITASLLSAGNVQLCKPPEKLRPLLTPLIQTQLQAAALVIPDQITFASVEGTPPENDPREKLKTIRMVMELTPLIPLGLLLMLTVIAVHSLKSWLDWWGVPFFITGIAAILISLSGAPVIGSFLKRLIAQKAPTYLPEAFSNYASDLASAVMQALAKPILWQGIILASLGLVMVLISKSISQKAEHLSEAKTPV